MRCQDFQKHLVCFLRACAKAYRKSFPDSTRCRGMLVYVLILCKLAYLHTVYHLHNAFPRVAQSVRIFVLDETGSFNFYSCQCQCPACSLSKLGKARCSFHKNDLIFVQYKVLLMIRPVLNCCI